MWQNYIAYSPSIARGMSDRAHRMYRVGIVGAGSMSAVHQLAWRQTDAQIAAIYTRTNRTPQHVSPPLPICRTLSELFDRVDIVDICTPTHTHAEIACAAANAGKHILCEKPLARTEEDARRIVACCAKNNVRIMVAHVLRFFPEYKHALHLFHAESHRLGSAAVLRLYRHCSTPHGAARWFLNPSYSGGVIVDLMIHDIDFAVQIAGSVDTLYATRLPAARNAHTSSKASDCSQEHALLVMRHHSGALSHIEGSWAFPHPTFKMGYEIALQDRLLCYDSEQTKPMRTYAYQNDTPPHQQRAKNASATPQPQAIHPYIEEIQSFYHALQRNTKFVVDIQEALNALKIALAADYSAHHGSVVTL